MTLLAIDDPFCSECVTMGKKTPKTASSPWNFITLLEEDRATAIGNMHRKIGKDHARGSQNILSNRQTERRAHHNTSSLLPQAK